MGRIAAGEGVRADTLDPRLGIARAEEERDEAGTLGHVGCGSAEIEVAIDDHEVSTVADHLLAGLRPLDAIGFRIGIDGLNLLAEQTAGGVDLANAVKLEIEEFEPLIDMRSATAPGPRLIHPDWQSYAPAAGPDFPRRGNIACECISSLDTDVKPIFASAHWVIEDEFVSQRQYQAYLEPKAVIGIYRDGRYIVHTGHQFPFNLRARMAQFFDVLPSAVRVIGHPIGGGFGGKLDYSVEPYAAALSKAAGGRPVRIANSRVEDLMTANCREDTIVKIRSALDEDGNVLARDVEAHLDNGAYTGEMAYLTPFPFHTGAINYRVGAFRAVGRLVFTNTPPTGAMRGVSGVPMYAALENHMDHIARDLGVDRRTYRLRHLFDDGDSLPNGQVLHDAGILGQAFDTVEGIAPWRQVTKKTEPLEGVGIAAAVWLVNPLPGAATVKIEEDGTVSVITGATANGSGSLATGLPQIVAEVLTVSPEQVRVSDPDTDLTGWDGGSQGGRTTQVVGNAARLAAEEVRAKLIETAAELLQAESDTLELADGAVRVAAKPDVQMSLAEVATAALFGSGPIQGTGRLLIPPVGAVVGPKSVDLCAEIADGMEISVLAGAALCGEGEGADCGRAAGARIAGELRARDVRTRLRGRGPRGRSRQGPPGDRVLFGGDGPDADRRRV